MQHQRIPQPQPTSLQQLHKFQTPPHLTLAPTDGMIDTIVMSPNVAAIQQNQHQAFITSKNSALLPPPNQNKYGHIHNVSDLCLIFPLSFYFRISYFSFHFVISYECCTLYIYFHFLRIVSNMIRKSGECNGLQPNKKELKAHSVKYYDIELKRSFSAYHIEFTANAYKY